MLLTALFVITLMSLAMSILSAAVAAGVSKKNSDMVNSTQLQTRALAAAVDAIQAMQDEADLAAAEFKKLNATVATLVKARANDSNVNFALASIPAEYLPRA